MQCFSRRNGLIVAALLVVTYAALFRRNAAIDPQPSSTATTVKLNNEDARTGIPDATSTRTALKELRRSFRPTITHVGTPSASNLNDTILLEAYHIHANGTPRLEIAPGHQAAAYFVQFAGPIMPEWKRAVVAAGGTIHGYLPYNTLSVDLTPAAAKRIARDAHVARIVPILPDYKVEPFLTEIAHSKNEELPARIPVTISTYSPDDISTVAAEVGGMGAEVVASDAGKRWGWIRAVVTRNRIGDIAQLGRVQWIEEYVEPGLVNDRAVLGHIMNVTNAWFAHGLTGSGQIIGHADTGLDIGSMPLLHADLRGRVIAAYDRGRAGRWDDTNGHGTHTAGSIMGNGTLSTGTIRGVAWEASLVHQSIMDSGGGLGGLPSDLNELYLQTYTNGARIHSDSWGSSVFGIYTTSSRQSDEFMWDHPDMLLVFAAGNDGYDGNADGVVDQDSIGAPATAKNIVTVGASENDRAPGTGGNSAYTYGAFWSFDFPVNPINIDYLSSPYDGIHQGMAAYSSRGPTDDGRNKPDVVAPGTDVASTRSRAVGASPGWGIHANNNYNYNGGTSMATPLVAGAAALVRQYLQEYRHHEKPSAALVKALLAHGARPMAPGQYGTNTFQEVPDAIPNPVAGWGHVNIENTLFPDDAKWFHVDDTNGLATPSSFEDHVFFAETGTVRATLNYTDFPATTGGGLKLVNDLDLSLIGPGGIVAEQVGGPDRINNSEQIRYAVASAGVYTARVTAFNIPSGPQPYALIVSGPIIDKPHILHEPLPNAYETNVPYTVNATVVSAADIASDAASLLWRELSGTGDFTRVVMSRVTNGKFTADIPPRPRGSVIAYYLEVTSSVFTTTNPESAPGDVHTFEVTEPLTLNVSGFPADIFTVDPGYGAHTVASGNVVRLVAPAFTNTAPGNRVAIAGWIGSGSVPADGYSNETQIVMRDNSSITWLWVSQYSLTQTSNVRGLVDATTWWDAWSAATTVTTALETAYAGTNYGFTGWYVDGLRHPDNASPADSPAGGLIMYGPRNASARYLPASQDSNTNGLPDWWEQLYFGTSAANPATDSDNDGFTNIKEFQDRTNPRDGFDYPQAPSIAHLPLQNPQSSPAPWRVDAAIADNHAVSNALVFWQIDGGAWTSASLTASASNYTGNILGPGTNGNSVIYRIEATDFAGLKGVAGPYGFDVEYPIMVLSPLDLGEVGVPDSSTSNVFITVSNAGLAELIWEADHAVMYDTIESGTGTWTHAGQMDIWHIVTSRYATARHAWHYGNGPGSEYPDNAHAWLISGPVTLDGQARLTFNHWAKMEYDEDQQDDHYWDGGVVEISTNAGFSFDMLFPEGGYPHRITDNPASPFPPDTPCYGETAGWEEAAFDLSDYEGQTVRFRFRFGSDSYVTEEGWYIDDVRVTYTNEDAWSWLDVEKAGALSAGSTTNMVVTLDSTGIELAGRRRAVVIVGGNAPEQQAPFVVPVGIQNISREIIVTCGEHGMVSPSGIVLVQAGSSTSFLLAADAYYEATQVMTNGSLVSGFVPSAFTNFVWADVISNGTLHVVFEEVLANGLVPKWWLAENGLTNQTPEQEAVTDGDGDGMVAWQEYRAATDPNDPNSVAMTVLSVTPTNNVVIVEWLSYTNASYFYELQRTVDAGDGFLPVATNLPATPPVNVVTNESPPAHHEAYRVIMTVP